MYVKTVHFLVIVSSCMFVCRVWSWECLRRRERRAAFFCQKRPHVLTRVCPEDFLNSWKCVSITSVSRQTVETLIVTINAAQTNVVWCNSAAISPAFVMVQAFKLFAVEACSLCTYGTFIIWSSEYDLFWICLSCVLWYLLCITQ